MSENIGSEIGSAMLAIVGAVIGLATISVIVSKNANTSAVATSFGSALANVIRAATNPVSTASTNGDLSLGTAPFLGGLQ